MPAPRPVTLAVAAIALVTFSCEPRPASRDDPSTRPDSQAGCPPCTCPPRPDDTKAVHRSANTPIEADPLGVVELMPPDMTTGSSLMEALSARRSVRKFSAEPLDLETVSSLLWAATGVNRPREGKLTAPTAVNFQEITVWLAMPGGLFTYDPHEHVLRLAQAADLRGETGLQDFVGVAPLELVFVADWKKMVGTEDDDERAFYAATDAGFVSQNVYLYCASRGLATVVRGSVDRETLASIMNLPPDQHVVLAQSVGWPTP